MQILRDLRLGEFDVLVGINLLREGLDLPEVSLVAILDADKEGFLARRALADPDDRPGGPQRRGRVIMYADTITDSMRQGHRRDGAAPPDPDGVQRKARHHAADDPQGGARGDRGDQGGRGEGATTDKALRRGEDGRKRSADS